MPALPADVVAVVLSHATLPTIGCAARVCRDWRTASRAEVLALAVLRRRWQLQASTGSDRGTAADDADGGAYASAALNHNFDGWWQLLRAVARLDDYFVDQRRLSGGGESIHHQRLGCIVGAPFAQALDRLDREVQEFVLGIMAGFMPTEDGLFTYQGFNATPIHYRHSWAATVPAKDPAAAMGPAESDPPPIHVTPNNGRVTLNHGTVLVGRRGGRWEWSTDRLTWQPTTTTEIPAQSLFGGQGWALAHENQQLVRFLEDNAVVPLFRAQVPLALASAAAAGSGEGRFPRSIDDAFWVSTHGGVVSHNSSLLGTFAERCSATDSPTISCVTARCLTVHQLLQPPIMIRTDRPADSVIPRLPLELRHAMEIVRPYRVLRAAGHTLRPPPPDAEKISETEGWSAWNVIQFADRQMRCAVLPIEDAAASCTLPEDAAGWVCRIDIAGTDRTWEDFVGALPSY